MIAYRKTGKNELLLNITSNFQQAIETKGVFEFAK